MTDTELLLAIDQAWAHTQKAAPGPELDEARQHLTHLRAVQAMRAQNGYSPKPKPPTTEWAVRPPRHR